MELHKQIKKNKFRLYFILFIAFLLIDPLPTPGIIEKMLEWLLIVGLFFSPYFMTGTRKGLIISIIIFIYMLFYRLLIKNGENNYFREINLIIMLVIFFGLITQILYYTLRHEVITEDLIFSGLTGFFLIAFGFTFVYETFQDFGLVSFYMGGISDRLIGDEDLFYYSLSCLSTLGIGDIVPLTPMAKRLTVIESSIGCLYVAVFIGRLVGLTINTHGKSPKGY